MSFNLLPLRFRCVRLGSFSAKTSRPPLILLSLNSSWKKEEKMIPVDTCLNSAFRWTYEGETFFFFFTFLSFPSLGRLQTEIKPTFIKLRNSRLTNSAVRPSIFPSADRQLSSTSSRTWNIEKVYHIQLLFYAFIIVILTYTTQLSITRIQFNLKKNYNTANIFEKLKLNESM